MNAAFSIVAPCTCPNSLSSDFGRCANRLEVLSRLSASLTSQGPEDLPRYLAHLIRPLLDFDFLDLIVFKEGTSQVLWHSIGIGEFPPQDVPTEETTYWWVYQQNQPLFISDWDQDERFAGRREALKRIGFEYRSLCRLPLCALGCSIGVLSFASFRPHLFSEEETHFLSLAAGLVSLAVVAALYREQLHCAEAERERSNNRSSEGSEWTRRAECSAGNGCGNLAVSTPKFPGIVGASSALQNVLRQIEIVAPTDSSVFIGGESGTGKELIARAIHRLSDRRDRPFVKVNCAAIPSTLLESELFGHEKGAFTGAVARKAGRFEVADKGTLFLDEVGDIPLEMQPKLLRVLQEREFERLGSTRTQKVDVRVIAATHRDLPQMIQDGKFRADLYYRLNVFPITLPALRERPEDIPALVRHYVGLYAGRMKRHIGMIPAHSMETLTGYSWPGNVRELQNFIERSVILSPGKVLRAPLSELKECLAPLAGAGICTLEEAEREHVLRALRESNGVIGGCNGAAARLGMKRTTLAYRIRKLRIPVPSRMMHRGLPADAGQSPSVAGPPSTFEDGRIELAGNGFGDVSFICCPARLHSGDCSGIQQLGEGPRPE